MSLRRKAAPAQQLVGFVLVSERCQPQRECSSQDGSCPAHTDICDCSHCPAYCAAPPPLLPTCRFQNSEQTQKMMYFSCAEFITQHHSFFFFALQSYLLSCAESVATKPAPDCLRWLFTPLGRQFFLSCDWSVKSESTCEIYTSERDPGMPQEKRML